MRIIIDSKNENSPVRKAKKMIQKSLVQFLEDKRSIKRLLYELLATAEWNAGSERESNGLLRQESHTKRGLLWMNLVELPYAESTGTVTYHGQLLMEDKVQEEVIDGANFLVEVFGFGNSTPLLCDPYGLISGNRKDEVKKVAENVDDILKRHHERCGKCRFD